MMSRSRLAASLLTLALALPAVAHAQIPDSAIPLRTVIDEMNTFRTTYAEDYNKKDVAALMKLYASDAIVTNAEGETMVGHDAINEYMTKNAPNFPHIVINTENVVAYGHTAIDVGTVKLHPASGGEMTQHYLVVLRRGLQKGDWKIVRLSVVPVAAMKM
jgi:ketosteroid isomerase-like protein